MLLRRASLLLRPAAAALPPLRRLAAPACARLPLVSQGRLLSTDAQGEDDTEALLDRWVKAKRARRFDVSDDLQALLRKRGVDPSTERPDPRRVMEDSPRQHGPFDAATEALLDEWVAAKVAKDYRVADRVRNELYLLGIDPHKARQAEKHRWTGGLARSKQGPFDEATEALLDAWVAAKRDRDFRRADAMAERLREKDIEPSIARPPPGARRRLQSARLPNPEIGPFDEETQDMLDRWVEARRQRNFGVADGLRDKLREMNIEPEASRPNNRDRSPRRRREEAEYY